MIYETEMKHLPAVRSRPWLGGARPHCLCKLVRAAFKLARRAACGATTRGNLANQSGGAGCSY